MVGPALHHWIKKFKYIKDYLEIQRIRYGSISILLLTFDEQLHDAPVPSPLTS